jgi:hypothetical protein
METNPHEYNNPVAWAPQQNQVYAGGYVTARPSQQQPSALQMHRPQQGGREQKPKPPKPMPKAQALALARTLKKWLAAAALVGFLSLSGLVAYHQVGTTTTASQTSSGSSQTTSASNSSSQNNNGFFNQQGGNNFGTSSSSQAPVSGSSVS